jgi:hypothetical protein
MELEVFDRNSVKEFIRRILGKIENTKGIAKYDYVLFDCHPLLHCFHILFCPFAI